MVLRKQVPIRFDEEARSWLGGLPRLPGDMGYVYVAIQVRDLAAGNFERIRAWLEA